MLWIIYAESALYCGYGQHFVVEALNKSSAEFLADADMQEYFYEQDYDQAVEEGQKAEAGTYSIMSCEPFGPDHESWEFYCDPGQSEFYTRVNV